jgi:hypothetical protein
MINAVNLAKETPELVTVPIKRLFGQVDMYKDDTKFTPEKQMRIKRKLCDNEQAASRIIAKVVDAEKVSKSDISLSRHDKDLLRKFLFVMKYRSPVFFRRFNHQTAAPYASNDRARFLEYMRLNNFQRPLDVWFDNLLKIIDAPMDPAGKWIADLSDRIYAGDAEWLFMNIRST